MTPAPCLLPSIRFQNHTTFQSDNPKIHHAGDRKQAAAAFQRHFAKLPCDIIGATMVSKLYEEE